MREKSTGPPTPAIDLPRTLIYSGNVFVSNYYFSAFSSFVIDLKSGGSLIEGSLLRETRLAKRQLPGVFLPASLTGLTSQA